MRWLRKAAPQALRRTLQLGVLAFVVYTALGGAWRNYKHAHNHPRLVRLMEGELWAWLYEANEDALSLLGRPAEASLDFLAFPWSARVFGVDTVDPILVAGFAIDNGSLPLGLLLSLLVPVLLALLFGKVFCSHLCPMRFVFELGQLVRRGMLRLGAPLPDLGGEQRLGGWVLLGGLVATLFTSTAIWLFILPYASLSAGIFLAVTTGTASVLLAVVAGWFLVDLLLAPGYFCKNLCPTGFLLENLGRLSLLKLRKRGEEPCPTGCTICTDTCPYHLSPKERTHRPACDNCGRCALACPSDRLVRRLTVLTVLALALLSLPDVASAHHNKGLPHYGYFENYPQVPVDEYVAIDGRWEIGATIFNFQGYESRTTSDTPNDVKIFLYLYDLEADQGYRGPLSVEIRRDGRVVSRFDRVEVDEEAIYSTRETLPESGVYELVAEVEGASIVLPFYVELADDRVNWWLLGGIALPLLLLFVLALLGRSRRRRRPSRAAREAAKKASAGTAALLLILWPLLAPAVALAQEQLTGRELALRADPEMAAAIERCQCGDPDAVGCEELTAAIGDYRPVEHYETEVGAVMVMGGIPGWLLVSGAGGIILISFVATERFAPRVTGGFRLNLVRSRRLYAVVRSRWFQAVPQLAMVGVLAFLIYVGLFGSPFANLTPVVVWTIWWAVLIFSVLLLASAWCFVCPWDGLANLATRLRLAARVDTLSFGLRFPDWLKNTYPAIALFALLTWLELGYGVTTDPKSTAVMGLGMVGLAVAGALLWDGKRFCAHVCPVGRICGIYSMVAPVEIRARKARTCQACKTEDCLHGNERGYACPTGISLKVAQSSAMCTMCTECIKSCDKQNVAINLRPFGADLRDVRSPRLDEAWLALTLLTLTLFHGLSMTSLWEDYAPGATSILKWMSLTLGTPRVLSFTIAMAAVSAVPIGLYWLSCRAAAWWAGGGVGTRTVFLHYAYSLLPVALFYHLAHNLAHVLMEGAEVVPLLSDPMGTGANLFGTRELHLGAAVAEDTLWYVQVGLILVGHVAGVLVAHRLSRKLYEDKRAATRSLVPMTVMMILISVAGLSLMALDMNMRMGRM